MSITDNTIRQLQEAVKTDVLEIGDKKFTTRAVHKAPLQPEQPKALTLYSLTGLVDYIKNLKDENETAEIFIHVEEPDSVVLITKLYSEYHLRDTLIKCAYAAPDFDYGRFWPVEEFIIGLSSKFVPTEARASLLALVGNVRAQKSLQTEDDGISQRVIARKGVHLEQQVTQVPFVTLAPYRTFTEVEQPESMFLFRMQARNEDSPPQCALFEADGGAWANEARIRIRDWLKAALAAEEAPIVVLA